MKNAIKDRIMLSETEKKDLWNNATFVFDTNVLLELYRVTRKASDAMLNAIERVSDRIWLPMQVVNEFGKNRYRIIYENADKYTINSKIRNAEKTFIETCSSEVKDKEMVAKLQKNIDDWIEVQSNEDKRIIDPSKDEILNKLLDLFKDKVGKGFSADKLENIKKEGELRYKSKIPPGYCDEKQKQDNEYGDLIIWKEIIEYSKVNNNDVIFVTQDVKEDWWFKEKGRTIGPRYELREEFSNATKHLIHFYTLNSFLEISKNQNEVNIEQSIIDELNQNYNEKELNNYYGELMLKLFNKRFLNNIKKRDDLYYTADDISKILAYANAMNHEGVETEEIAESQGYLQGILDVYSILSGIGSEKSIKKLEKTMLNSDEVKEALAKLIEYKWEKD